MVSRGDSLPDDLVDRILVLHAEKLPNGSARSFAQITAALLAEGHKVPRQTVHRIVQRHQSERLEQKRAQVREVVGEHADANVREMAALAAELAAVARTGVWPGKGPLKTRKLSAKHRIDAAKAAIDARSKLVAHLGLHDTAPDVGTVARAVNRVYGWDVEHDGDEGDSGAVNGGNGVAH